MNEQAWSHLRRALLALDSAPKRIREAEEVYTRSVNYAKTTAKQLCWGKDELRIACEIAAGKRDTVVKTECEALKIALVTGYTYREYPGETVDMGSALKSALAVISAAGERLPPARQAAILEDFRGKPATLTYIGRFFSAHKLILAPYAAYMAAPIDETALNNVKKAIKHAEITGKWEDSPIYWTKNAFSEALNRLGLNGSVDPYVEALKFLCGRMPEKRLSLSKVIQQINCAASTAKILIFERGITEITKTTTTHSANERLIKE